MHLNHAVIGSTEGNKIKNVNTLINKIVKRIKNKAIRIITDTVILVAKNILKLYFHCPIWPMPFYTLICRYPKKTKITSFAICYV